MRRATILRTLLASNSILFFSVLAFASEEGATPAEESTVGEVFKWLHFIIILAAAYWLFAKVLPPVVRRNADKISEAISKATAAKAEADRQLREAATKLTHLEQEIAEFRTQAQKDAAAELERLRAVIKVDLEKVTTAAKAEIEAAERAARVELKALAAKLAVDHAESLVAQQMTPAVQDSMINNFVQTLQRRPN